MKPRWIVYVEDCIEVQDLMIDAIHEYDPELRIACLDDLNQAENLIGELNKSRLVRLVMADWDLKEHGVGEDIIVYAKKLCLPTLMMSGLERNTVADKYLKKPININDLYKILDKYVKQ